MNRFIKNFFVLILTSILIFGNWTVWIYAVSTNRIIDASFGYFIFPIISVFFGYIFLREKLNNKRIPELRNTIIDGEFVKFTKDGQPYNKFLCFDIYFQNIAILDTIEENPMGFSMDENHGIYLSFPDRRIEKLTD